MGLLPQHHFGAFLKDAVGQCNARAILLVK
jgi:hypothetical protein